MNQQEAAKQELRDEWTLLFLWAGIGLFVWGLLRRLRPGGYSIAASLGIAFLFLVGSVGWMAVFKQDAKPIRMIYPLTGVALYKGLRSKKSEP